MLEARALSCFRDDRHLFSALNLRVLPGQLIQIAGENGSGKSSLLHILAGLATPEQGEVLWQHQPVFTDRSRYHAALLFLGHRPGITPALTALENLRFYHARQPDAALWQALEQVDLAGFETVPVGQLSAGQQRRVALARLWLTAASLWILDEPFTALDVHGIAQLVHRMQTHLAAQGSIILTTHQPLPAACRPDQLIRLDDHKEALCG